MIEAALGFVKSILGLVVVAEGAEAVHHRRPIDGFVAFEEVLKDAVHLDH
jgi:hypothetical protein